jgi:hypothetical protein
MAPSVEMVRLQRQAMANEPDLPGGEGRFSPLLPKLLGTLAALYPPKPARRRS